MLQATKARLDTRTRALGGDGAWIRTNMEVFAHKSQLKAHDWMQLLQSAGDYVLADLFPQQPERAEALFKLLAVCNTMLNTTSDHTSDNRDQIDALKVQVVEALCLCEAVLPITELAVVLHIMLHIPDCMYRWNSIRNFWSFFGERCMGWVIRFINNRDLAAENIMTANCRLRFILDSPAGAINKLVSKLELVGHALPPTSVLSVAKEIQKLKDGLAGEYSFNVRPTWRNSRNVSPSDVATEEKSITTHVRTLWRSLKNPASYAPKEDAKCVILVAGVTINGRKFRQGAHCEYLPKVVPRGNLPGPGGQEGSSQSHRVGTICLFYLFEMKGGPSPEVFVSIKPRPILSRQRSMYIVANIKDDTSQPQFAHSHTNDHTLIHIDSITGKIMLVPHYNVDESNTLMCAIKMWGVR